MNTNDPLEKDHILIDECLIIKTSGELPEVAYHGSIHYLVEDPQGPQLHLSATDQKILQEAVVERYRLIILRDLIIENRDKDFYRGLKRSVANWQRLSIFATANKHDLSIIREEVSRALISFISHEIAEVTCGLRQSCVNCSVKDLSRLVHNLRLTIVDLPSGWERLCTLDCDE